MSRELKADTEQASAGTSGLICKDGIVAVVNNTNSISNLTKEQLKNIYANETTTWQTYGSQLNTNVTRYSRDTTSQQLAIKTLFQMILKFLVRQ